MKSFIILLSYKKPLEEVDKHVKEHIVYLDKYFHSNNFLLSGRKNPRTGGVILCKFNSIEEVYSMIKEDPFYIYEIADYEVIEFEPSKGVLHY
jgi:uncharacterized protein YciI